VIGKVSARNVGEWSEVYAIAKLLAGEIITSPYRKSLRIDAARLQHSVSEPPIEYKVSNTTISLSRDNGAESKVEREEVSELAKLLLADIRRKSKRTFESRSGNALSEVLGFRGTSTVLRDDVRVRFNAGRSTSWRGLSIKSFLGARPTLLNASPATNFVFKLSGSPRTLKQVAKLGHFTMRPLFKFLNENSVGLEFVFMDSKTFEQSLRSFSPKLGPLVAKLLSQAAFQRRKSLREVWIEATKSGRGDVQIVDSDFLNFLGAVGLGLQPATRWIPRGVDFGGFLIVNANGEVELLDEAGIEALGARLFNELRFEWGSRARHKFGVPYQIDGEVFLKLNLQLRF
jgi:hypothetical protein